MSEPTFDAAYPSELDKQEHVRSKIFNMGQSTKDSNSRPGWRGPGRSKPSRPSGASKKKTPDIAPSSQLPWSLQQLILNIFRTTFTHLSEGGRETSMPNIDAIKQALFERDFQRAFDKPEFLEAYAFRWSPSRALCYASVLVDLHKYLSEILPTGWNGSALASGGATVLGGATEENVGGFSVTCFGGGAAEAVAFGGFLHHLHNTISSPPVTNSVSLAESASKIFLSVNDAVTSPECVLKLNLHLVDRAEWSPVANALARSLITPPALSKYASPRAIAASTPLIPSSAISVSCTKSDILALNTAKLSSCLTSSQGKPQLITLLFTLNELYAASTSRTTAFLLELTACVPRGSLLLVIDSPGSYSIARIGGSGIGNGRSSDSNNNGPSNPATDIIPDHSPPDDSPDNDSNNNPQIISDINPIPAPSGENKKSSYPMDWLLNHTLLGQEPNVDGEEDQENPPRWQKVVTNSSQWFRLPPGLKYPYPLENMRYQIHLYRRL